MNENMVIVARGNLLLKAVIVTLTALTILLGIFPELVMRYFEG